MATTQTDHHAAAAHMRAHPHTWTVICHPASRKATHEQVRRIRTGFYKAYRGAGWEATYDRDTAGRYQVKAQWTGPAAATRGGS